MFLLNSPNQVKLFSPDFLSSLAKFANVLIVAAFEMVWHEALADVLEKGKVVIADDADGSDDGVDDDELMLLDMLVKIRQG